MIDIGIDLLVDCLSEENSGLNELFAKWNEGSDWTYELKFDNQDNMLIVVTELGAQKVEVFRIDITRLV
jgi:hypothetical protein